MKITITNEEAEEEGNVCEVHVFQPTKAHQPGWTVAFEQIEPGKSYSTYVHRDQYVQVQHCKANESRLISASHDPQGAPENAGGIPSGDPGAKPR